jgi:hypothetical protein
MNSLVTTTFCCVLNEAPQAFFLFLASQDPSPVRLLCIHQLTDQQKWISDLHTYPDLSRLYARHKLELSYLRQIATAVRRLLR